MTGPMSSIAAIKGSVASAPMAGNQARQGNQAHQTQANPHPAHHAHEAREAARPQAEAPRLRSGEASVAATSTQQDGAIAQILSGALKGASSGNPDGLRQDAGQPEQTVAQAFKTVKDYLGSLPSELQFDYDEEANRQVFRVVNPVTHEVVKQYPPDEFLEMIKRLKELDKNADDNGMLFDDRS